MTFITWKIYATFLTKRKELFVLLEALRFYCVQRDGIVLSQGL